MVDALVSDYIQMLHNISLVISDDCIDSKTVDGVPIRKLFVSNLAERTTFKDLQKCFSVHGNIESCYLRRNQGKSNYAFVTFSCVEDAVKALKDGSRKQIRLHNRDLRVMPADSWHQPDSIEQQFYHIVKESKASDAKTANDQYAQGCQQNDIESVSIHMLNNDCLRHIFTFLPIVDRARIEMVCKRWRILSQESWRIVKKLDLLPSTWGFSAIGRIHTVTLRKVLLKCGRYLTEINLSDSPNCLSQSTLTIIGKLCPNLTRIDVSALTTCASGLHVLANNCTNITKFCLGPSIHSLDNDLKYFFLMHQTLEYFAINNNTFSGKCLSHLPPQTIHTIILNKCPYVQDDHVSTALKRLDNLKNLVIAECIGISVRTMEVISKHCNNLRVLEFHGSLPLVRLMNNMLYFTNLVNLQVLKITCNSKISDELLVNMVLHCQQLTCIDITGCGSVTDVGITSIATLPKLEKLMINYMDRVTDDGLRNLNGLKELECRACPAIRDEGISVVIASSPHLQLLDLSGCWDITNATLEVAKQICDSRSNNVMLKIIVGGTSIFPFCSFPTETSGKNLSPFLQTVNVNMCHHDTYNLKLLQRYQN